MSSGRRVVQEIPGTRYGYWRVEGFAGFDRRGNAMWKCICTACGQSYHVRGFALRAGKSRHCVHCNTKGFDNT